MESNIIKNWENYFVPEPVLKAIEKEGFLMPTDIQKLVLPSAIRDRLDILGAAATGTGKTLAFGIPMISRILMDRQKEIDMYESKEDNQEIDDEDKSDNENDENECDLSPDESEMEDHWNDDDIKPEIFIGAEPYNMNGNFAKPYQHIYGLVLTPTRELACQVTDHLKRACQFTDLKVCSIFGGMSVDRQERLLNKKPEIVVVTPGRFWSFIQDQESHAVSCSKLSVLVIDEADRMLEKGHFAELESLVNWLKTNEKDRIVHGIPMKPRQTFVFSATLTFVHSSTDIKVKIKKSHTKLTKNDKLKSIIAKLGMNENPKIIDSTLDVAQLSHWKILCPSQEDKDIRLFWFIKNHPGRTIVFANSKNAVRRLASVLQTLGLKSKSLMADMQQKMRLKKLDSFASTENSLLIASDVAARGLDIPRVDYVVHFDVAHTAETHLHRSGRTARASNPGHSVIMLSPNEVSQFHKLLFSLKKSDADIREIPVTRDSMEPYGEVVKLAREIESKSHVVKGVVNTKSWFEKMAAKADIALDDDISDLKKQLPSKQVTFEQQKKTELLMRLIDDLETDKSTFVSPIIGNAVVCDSDANVNPSDTGEQCHPEEPLADKRKSRKNRKRKATGSNSENKVKINKK